MKILARGGLAVSVHETPDAADVKALNVALTIQYANGADLSPDEAEALGELLIATARACRLLNARLGK